MWLQRLILKGFSKILENISYAINIIASFEKMSRRFNPIKPSSRLRQTIIGLTAIYLFCFCSDNVVTAERVIIVLWIYYCMSDRGGTRANCTAAQSRCRSTGMNNTRELKYVRSRPSMGSSTCLSRGRGLARVGAGGGGRGLGIVP